MITVLDYGAGNIASVKNVLDELKIDYLISNREMDICKGDKIIFPGVGEASFAIKKLHLMNLFNLLRIIKKPFLGICLGMQLLAEKSDEGNVTCLGVYPGTIKKFEDTSLQVPHMGWNNVNHNSDNKLFHKIKSGELFYFANSYYMPENEFQIATSEYGLTFASAMMKNNFYGVQFHPEKSGAPGIQLIKNFIELC
ncbi:MAG: imidazole glycerol phosphate synthase subunit HisH [Ignavibacteriaceae bacterium]|jgi:glutamine amidotransferase|nr:imidazole glycerol phosphate synthase subunit HisH [Ignavibacteriaceae bacterium]